MRLKNNHLKKVGHIHLDFETISVIEASLKITEISIEGMSDHDIGNAIRLPDDDKYYKLEFISLEGEAIEEGDKVSHDIWAAIRVGVLKDGDKVAIEVDTTAYVLPEKPEGDSWVANFSEALCVSYARIRHNHKLILIHSADKIVYAGDKESDYHRKWEKKKK